MQFTSVLFLVLSLCHVASAADLASTFYSNIPQINDTGTQITGRRVVPTDLKQIECTSNYAPENLGRNLNIDKLGRNLDIWFQRCVDHANGDVVVYKAAGYADHDTKQFLGWGPSTVAKSPESKYGNQVPVAAVPPLPVRVPVKTSAPELVKEKAKISSPKQTVKAPQPVIQVEGVALGDCCKNEGAITRLAKEQMQVANVALGATVLEGAQPTDSQYNPKCDQLISHADGSLGPLGKKLDAELKKDEYAQFLNDSFKNVEGMKETCPNYINLTSQQREFFWVWTFTSIAQKESSCGVNNVAQGPTEKAVGMLMLEETPPKRKTRMEYLQNVTGVRGLYDNCNVGSVTSPEHNLTCGVDVMYSLLLGLYGDPKLIGRPRKDPKTGKIRNSSYWQELNDSDGEIVKLIKKLDICKIKK